MSAKVPQEVNKPVRPAGKFHRGRSHGMRAADVEAEEVPIVIHPVYTSPRGMHDILPADRPYWDVIHDTVAALATSFNYHRIETPMAEVPGLFERSLGGTSDVVAKEMFFVRDRSGKERLGLRPENTAGVVRAYLEHGMHTQPQPVRLWYWGPFFRHDRPQAGRYRQFWQFGFEMIGEVNPIIDAQLIHLAHEVYRGLELEAFRIDINSIGHPGPGCRADYLTLLKDHAHANLQKLCRDCKLRYRKNPMRILDCKEEKCQMVANTAPKITEHLCDACATHYRELLRILSDLRIPVKQNPRLVRGLDYYTRTVFEVVPAPMPGQESGPAPTEGGGSESSTVSATSLGGGGRYDGLVELLGGPPTAAVGFAAGVERTILAMRREGIDVRPAWTPELFLIHLGDLGRKRALLLFDELRRAGFRVAEAFHKSGIKAQLRVADRHKITWALILGQKEALDGTVILRNMESGVQETVDLNLDVLLPALRKRLRREGEPLA